MTGKCNLNCKFCPVPIEDKDKLNQRERTADEWIHMAEEAKKAGTIWVSLIGGEVTLHPEFCDIYTALAKLGFLITIYTNATMVTDSLIKIFRIYPPRKISITMCGASNKTYQTVCGCRDGYDRFSDGVYRLLELPTSFEIRTMLIEDNKNDLNFMKQFAEERFGQGKRLIINRPIEDCVYSSVTCARKYRLIPEQNAEIHYPELFELCERIQNGEKGILKNPGKLKIHNGKCEDGNQLFSGCNAGIDRYTISWKGNLHACSSLNHVYTKPFETGFQEAWEILPKQYPENKQIDKCRSCKYMEFCEACPASRFLETGDWFGVPEYVCKEAKYLYDVLEKVKIIERVK